MGILYIVLVVRLVLRLFFGVIWLSVGISKLSHVRRFHHHLLDYQLFPLVLETKLKLSLILACCIPILEVGAGLGVISGDALSYAVALSLSLLLLFSLAIALNLLRDRADLSCHCAGVLGNHRISWWLVGRNSVLMAGLLILLVTPVDTFTVGSVLHRASAWQSSAGMNGDLAIFLLVGVALAILLLLNAAWSALRPR